MSNQGEAWSNYWQGRTGTEAGAALVGVGIEKDAEIAAFWDQILSQHANPVGRFLDLACGAGSVLRRAAQHDFSMLCGLDISDEAITLLRREEPRAVGLAASAHDIPVMDGSFSLITSQFGFEYADAFKSVNSIMRALAPGGRFTAMVHRSDGAIAKECARAAEDCDALTSAGFEAASLKVFEAAYAQNQSDLQSAIAAMTETRAPVMMLAEKGHGFAQHLLRGTASLFERRDAYAIDDIKDWLDAMRAQNIAHGQRMRDMLSAALTPEEVHKLNADFEAAGAQVDPITEFNLGPSADPIAWIVSVSRPS